MPLAFEAEPSHDDPAVATGPAAGARTVRTAPDSAVGDRVGDRVVIPVIAPGASGIRDGLSHVLARSVQARATSGSGDPAAAWDGSAGHAGVVRGVCSQRTLARLDTAPPQPQNLGGGVGILAPPDVWTAVDINTLTARQCWDYLIPLRDPRNAVALASWPAIIRRGARDSLRFGQTDRLDLETRLAAELPTAVAELKAAMAGSAAIFTARNMASPNAPGSAMAVPASADPIEQELGRLLDSALAENRIVGFDDWVMSKLTLTVPANGAITEEQRRQHGDAINELRETMAQLAGGAATSTADMRETAVPRLQPGPTADITLADQGATTGQVEVKTVRLPITRGQDLIGQLGPALSKFQTATNDDNEAVVYASYAPAHFPHPADESDQATAAVGQFIRGRLNANSTLQGKEHCRAVTVRMENGKSFRLTPANPNSWVLAWV